MMDDLISRRGAIETLIENKEMINAVLDSLTLDYNTRRNQEQRRGQINEDIETIKALPSVQSETTNEEMRFALKQLGAYFLIKIRDKKEGDVPVELLQRIEKIQEYIDNLPSVQSKRGKWIPWKYHDGFRCEYCNEPVDNKHNFCPNCGADMRGERIE